MFHSPNGQMLVGCIENCTNKSTKATNYGEDWEFPNAKV